MIDKSAGHPGGRDLSDIHRDDWVQRCLPAAWRPYARLARLDRPVGTWLTLLPCLAALVQAEHGLPTPARVLIFSLGALLMRSAGSTANDIADRNFDAHVERTRFRLLACGDLRRRRALIFLIFELALAALLLPFLNQQTRWLAVALLPLVFLYPVCKRFTHWPQAVLGAAFNWGMLMAWSDTRGMVPAGAIVMWFGAVLWQIGYDTIYAYTDVHDDARLGLRSTAILFGRKGRMAVGLFYVATLICWTAGGWLVSMGTAYYVGTVFLALHLTWQTVQLDVLRPYRNFLLFKSNMKTGVLLLFAAALGVIPQLG